MLIGRNLSGQRSLSPAITDTVNFAPDIDGYYCNNKATIFVPESVLFSCAIANSQVSAWYASKTFATKEGGFFDFEPRYSSQTDGSAGDAKTATND